MRRLTRRRFLVGASAALAAVAPRIKRRTAWAQKAGASSRKTWTNWSGVVTTRPNSIEIPDSEEAIVALVRKALSKNIKLRAAGSGHSFVPLCAADDGILLTLNRLRGIISTDAEAREALVWGGTKIFQMGAPLLDAGLSMETLSDVDVQALAGAIATGTHGTGRTLKNLSNQVIGLRIITGTGDILECSEDREREIFKAAQVSLGALGIVTQVRLRMLTAYSLHEKIWRAPFAECLEQLDELITSNRHFEFFWTPGNDLCFMKTLNITEASPDSVADTTGERIGPSHKILPSTRSAKFNETEFSLPSARGPECVSELRDLLLTKHKEVSWPLEYRSVAADDIYLSPASGRETVTISAHRRASRPHEDFFKEVEGVFRNYGGRPHWGKVHTHEAEELAGLYPEWERFAAVRAQLDPKGVFETPYMTRLLRV